MLIQPLCIIKERATFSQSSSSEFRTRVIRYKMYFRPVHVINDYKLQVLHADNNVGQAAQDSLNQFERNK